MEHGQPDDDEGDPVVRARMASARPDLDPMVRSVLRANAAAALFGSRATITVGRYELLREVGSGGGGSVFVARDPELAREIAIKLIVAANPVLRARALSEGQALAKLSHPNVVPVFDVGIADDRVYLVMELIRGDSLRAYAGRAGLREIVAAYRQAGEGLAAAHAAGIVHRDFKPDNAVIGADGRVRVIDFGLAQAGTEASVATAGGTPRYSAPEQRAGGAATAAADQYAFAVSLREAAERRGGESLPRWLDAVVRRAAADDPAARFPDMAALLRALANDPRTRWRRRALVGVPAVLAAAGFAIGLFARGDAAGAPRCDGAAALAPVWTPDRSASTEARLAALGTVFAAASAPRARGTIDRYAKRWIAGHEAACRAARTEPAARVVDRRAACLARARNQLDAALEVLAGVDAEGLSSAVRAISELPDLGRCEDPAALVDDVPPPPPTVAPQVAAVAADLDRALVGIEAATPAVEALADRVVARARALGYRPLLATALLAQGRAALALGQHSRALAPLVEAYRHAFAVGDHPTAVEAFARASWIANTTTGKADAALAGLDVVTALAERLGAPDRFAHALLHNNAGVVLLAAGRVDEARARLTAGLALARDVTGRGAIELAVVRTNLAGVTADANEREHLLGEALETVRTRLGADHPLTLNAEIVAAHSIGEDAAARAALRPPCTRYAELHPARRAMIVECASELVWLDLAVGAKDDARASVALVIAADGSDVNRERVALARGYAALLDGSLDAAASQIDALAARTRPDARARWWQLVFAADVELARVLVARARSAPAIERAARQRAIGYLDRAAALHSMPAIDRRRAWARQGMVEMKSP